MKLQELESKTKMQQSLKVFESYFGRQLAFDNITPHQAQQMLGKVRGLIKEHRVSTNFHRSEQDPSYLKLMVMERALESKIKEATTSGTVGTTGTSGSGSAGAVGNGDLAKGVAKVAGATGQQGQAQRLTKAIQNTAAGKTLDPASKAALAQHEVGIANLMKDPSQATRLQQMLKTASAKQAQSQSKVESRNRKGRRLSEASDLQQAQVVLAAQDMVDRLQKMIEDVSAMQFKDLPALVDSIRNEVGMDQAQQFNADATAALQGLVQGLQGSKQQLETAQGVLTGQAPVVPGQDAGMAAGGMPTPAGELGDAGAELDAAAADAEAAADLEADLETGSPKSLGRARR